MMSRCEPHEPDTGLMLNDSLNIGPSRRVTILVTVILLPLAAVFALLGCWLIACGMASVLGALFVGHLEAAGIILFLGFVSLIASTVMLSVLIMLIGHRREHESFVEIRRNNSRT